MPRNCTCGRYLGSRTVCECGRVVGSMSDASGTTTPDAHYRPDPLPTHSFDPASTDWAPSSFVDDPPDDHILRPAGWGGIRGYVVGGSQAPLGSAAGITAIRLILVGGLAVVALLKGPQIAEAITNAAISLVLIYLGPILILMIALALLSRIPGLTGCLGVLFRAMSFSWLLGRGRSAGPAGWVLQVETASGTVECHLAADAPLSGGEEVVVHGPAFGGVKHAWLLQCLSPRPFTRIGRGVLGLLLTLFVVAPLMFLLLTYL